MNDLQEEPMAQEEETKKSEEEVVEATEVAGTVEVSSEPAGVGPEAVTEEHVRAIPGPAAVAPTQDERTMAALAHASTLLNLVTGFLGVVVAFVIWLGYRDRSSYVGYQALQAFVFQLAAVVATAVGAVIVAIAWIISLALTVILVGFCLMPLALALTVIVLLIPLAALVYQLYAAIETYNGRDFEYRWVGPFVRKQGWV